MTHRTRPSLDLSSIPRRAMRTLARAYASIVALIDDQKVSRADLQVAADMDGSARDVVERLLALQVFDTYSDGSYSVEARLLVAWQASQT